VNSDLVYFYGIPVYFLSLLAFVVALIYAFVWPKQLINNPALQPYEKLFLRWGHSLSWVFLALAGFSWGSRNLGFAVIFAALGGLTYLFFMVILTGSARSSKR
jgi:hypothetical protein